MEMNFPHNGPTPDAELDLASEGSQQSDYAALIAHVVARQSLSHSARKVIAHEMSLVAAVASNRGRSLHNRIRFFAGQMPTEVDVDNKNLFIRGNFRPDLADQFFAKEGT